MDATARLERASTAGEWRDAAMHCVLQTLMARVAKAKPSVEAAMSPVRTVAQRKPSVRERRGRGPETFRS